MTGTETLMKPRTSDTSPDVERVVEATRHLQAFRTGYAELLERLAVETVPMPIVAAFLHLEPALRCLDTVRSGRFIERLHRIAVDVHGDWYEGKPDIDEATETLHAVVHEATNEVMAEIYRDTCVCQKAVTR